MRNCAKMGTQSRARNLLNLKQKPTLTSGGRAGVPWGAQGHQNGAQGHQNGAQGHQNNSETTPKWPQMDATILAL